MNIKAFEEENWTPQSYLDVSQPIMIFCIELLERFGDKFLSQIESLAGALERGCKLSERHREQNFKDGMMSMLRIQG